MLDAYSIFAHGTWNTKTVKTIMPC